MNVLVYSGSNPTHHSRSSDRLAKVLKTFLSKSYDIKLANSRLILEQPWQSHTSLIVFPNEDHPKKHSEEVPKDEDIYSKVFDWVWNGGNYLGFGSGSELCSPEKMRLIPVYFQSIQASKEHSKSDLDGDKSDDTKLNLTLSTGHHHSLSPTQEHDELRLDQHTRNLYVKTDDFKSEDLTNLEPILHYEHHHNQLAGFRYKSNKGSVILFGFEIDRPTQWLLRILRSIGLENIDEQVLSNPELDNTSPIYLMSCMDSITTKQIQSQILLEVDPSSNDQSILVDASDTFSFSNLSSKPTGALQVISCEDLTEDNLKSDVGFDWKTYCDELHQDEAIQKPQIGTTVLYADRITSTQTILEKNPKLMNGLPTGTIIIAKEQTNGRGRGNNNWISTKDSIQFSILLKLDQILINQIQINNLVFVQYLFGLAIVEHFEKKNQLEIRLKWPNDLYGSFEKNHHSIVRFDLFKKLGGVLVNVCFGGHDFKECRLIIGCGINNQSTPQSTTTSIKQLKDHQNQAYNNDSKIELTDLSLLKNEKIIAGICYEFDLMWNRFLINGFNQDFQQLYLRRWLHSGQIIKDEKDEKNQFLKIIGIHPIDGLLRTIKINNNNNNNNENNENQEFVDFQPDSNSFDMFSGLIRSKK